MNSTGGTVAFRVYASNGDIYLERNDGAVKLFAGYATNTWYDICVIAPGDGAAGTAYVTFPETILSVCAESAEKTAHAAKNVTNFFISR